MNELQKKMSELADNLKSPIEKENKHLKEVNASLLEALIYLTNEAKATMPFLDAVDFDIMDVALFKARAAIVKATQ